MVGGARKSSPSSYLKNERIEDEDEDESENEIARSGQPP